MSLIDMANQIAESKESNCDNNTKSHKTLNKLKEVFGEIYELYVLVYSKQKVCELLQCSLDELNAAYSTMDFVSLRKKWFWEMLFCSLVGLRYLEPSDANVYKFPFDEDRVKGAETAFGTLEENEQNVIFLRFSEGKTLDDIANMQGLSRERIRMIEAHALRKLRHPLRCEWFRNGYEAVSKRRTDRADAIKGLNECNKDALIKEGAALILVDELELSAHAYNSLKRSGVNTVADIMDLFETGAIHKVRNLGGVSISEVAEQVQKLGFKLNYDIK